MAGCHRHLASEGKNIKNITVSGVDFSIMMVPIFSYVATQLMDNLSGGLSEFIEALPQDVAPDARQNLTKVQQYGTRQSQKSRKPGGDQAPHFASNGEIMKMFWRSQLGYCVLTPFRWAHVHICTMFGVGV